jgi:hypothetical protein
MEGWVTKMALQDEWREFTGSEFATMKVLAPDSLGS